MPHSLFWAWTQGERLGWVGLSHWPLCRNKHGLSFSSSVTQRPIVCALLLLFRTLGGELNVTYKAWWIPLCKDLCKCKVKPAVTGRGLAFISTSALFIFSYRSNFTTPEFTTGKKKKIIPDFTSVWSRNIWPRDLSHRKPEGARWSVTRQKERSMGEALHRQHEKKERTLREEKGKKVGHTAAVSNRPHAASFPGAGGVEKAP